MNIKSWMEVDGVENVSYRFQCAGIWVGVRKKETNILVAEVNTSEVSKMVVIDFLKLFGFDIESIEPPKLSKREWHLVNFLSEEWWIARDMILYAFQSKPIKTNTGYFCGRPNDDYKRLTNDLFPFVTFDRAWSAKELRELEVEE